MSNIFDYIQPGLGIKRKLRNFSILLSRYIDNGLIYKLRNALNGYIERKIISHYGADYRWSDEKSQNVDSKHSNLGYGLANYALVKNLRPKRVLAIGSMYGFVPYMLARACQENGKGVVDFVDAGFDIADDVHKDNHYFGQGFWKKVDAKQHFSLFLDPKYITTNVETLKDFLKKNSHKYDYIHMDGDHSYAGLKRDVGLSWPRLVEGGIMAIHDIEFDYQELLRKNSNLRKEAGSLEFGVSKFWEEIQKTHPSAISISNNYSGLGLLQKRKVKKSKKA